jgi:hypothetical protein
MQLAFWWIFNIPFLWVRYLQGKGWAGVQAYRDAVFRGSPWLAGWFFVALLVGVPLVVLARRYLPAWAVVVAAFPSFVFALMSTLYRGHLGAGAQSFVTHFSATFFSPHAGPLTGLFWIALGMWAAERRAWLERAPLWIWPPMLALGIGLAAYECGHLIQPIPGGPRDVYISLLVVAPALFVLALRWQRPIPGAVFLRNASTVNFGAQFVLGAWFLGTICHLHWTGMQRGLAIVVLALALTAALHWARRVPGPIGRVAGYAY